MKKIIIIGVLIIVSKIIIAQQYYPFPTQNAIWREYERVTMGPSNTTYTNYQNFINGDTVVLGRTYHKIYKTGVKDGYNGYRPFSYTFENQYAGAYREDSAKHIFMLNTPSDYLLYDFNLHVGDTLLNPNGNNLQTAMFGAFNNNGFVYSVSEIDSVLVSGVFHKRYKIVYSINQNPLYLIEGIGATTGLFNNFFGSYPWGYKSNLICFKQDSLNAYPDGAACNLIYIGIDELNAQKQIHLFPNPSAGLINLENLPEGPINIEVLNILGKLVYEAKDAKAKQIIDLNFAPRGMYFIKIIQCNKPVLIEKIIIQL